MRNDTSLILALALLFMLAPVSSAAAEDTLIRLVVDPVEHAADRAPCEVRLSIPEQLDAATAASVRAGKMIFSLLGETSDGFVSLSARLDADWVVDESLGSETAPGGVILRWLDRPPTGENEARVYRLVTASNPSKDPSATRWSTRRDGPDTTLLFGGQPVWTAVGGFDGKSHETTFKSFDHLYGAGGRCLTKGPGGQYSHHRGAFVGWSKTAHHGRTDDFWHGRDGAHYLSEPLEDISLTRTTARVRRTSRWIGADGSTALRDTREVWIHAADEGERIFDYTITLEAVDGAVGLDGDPQHAGFQLRAAEEVQESKCVYVRPEGAMTTGNDVWENCGWVAGKFTVEGAPHLVLHADHPDNPASVYSTRDYGRFGAFFRGRVEPGDPLVVRYRVVVLGPEAAASFDVKRGNELARGFTQPVSARVRPHRSK